MPITRATIEASIIKEYGKVMLDVGLDGTTDDGTNADLNDPISMGLDSLGLSLADLSIVADVDFAPISTLAATNQLKAIAKLETLEMILSSWNQPNQSSDTDNSQNLGDLMSIYEERAVGLRAKYQLLYGYGLGSLSAGVIDLGFVETIDVATGRPA